MSDIQPKVTNDPAPEEVRVTVVWLARYAREAYSRPREMIPLMALEIIDTWSKRGATSLHHVELTAAKYSKMYPRSVVVINIFLDRVRKDHHVP